MKPFSIRCKKVDALHAFSCLQQVRMSIGHGYDFQPQVRQFLKERRHLYDVPLFADTNYLTDCDLNDSCDDALQAIIHMGLGRGILVNLAGTANHFRRETFLIDVLALRHIQCSFRRIDAYLAGNNEDHKVAFQLQGELGYSQACIECSVGRKHFYKAGQIETFNQGNFGRHYTIQEVLEGA